MAFAALSGQRKPFTPGYRIIVSSLLFDISSELYHSFCLFLIQRDLIITGWVCLQHIGRTKHDLPHADIFDRNLRIFHLIIDHHECSGTARTRIPKPNNLEGYDAMSKEELIQELIKARITEVRLKKGYEVKGDGSVILYNSKNTR